MQSSLLPSMLSAISIFRHRGSVVKNRNFCMQTMIENIYIYIYSVTFQFLFALRLDNDVKIVFLFSKKTNKERKMKFSTMNSNDPSPKNIPSINRWRKVWWTSWKMERRYSTESRGRTCIHSFDTITDPRHSEQKVNRTIKWPFREVLSNFSYVSFDPCISPLPSNSICSLFHLSRADIVFCAQPPIISLSLSRSSINRRTHLPW